MSLEEQLNVLSVAAAFGIEYTQFLEDALENVLTVVIDGVEYQYLEIDDEDGLSEGDYIISSTTVDTAS